MAGGQGPAKRSESINMTVNQRLIEALEGFGLPVVPGADTAHRDRCLSFLYDLLPAQFADNAPRFLRALVQVHLTLPLDEDSVKLRLDIARALAAHGFSWPEIVDAGDGDAQHHVLETEILTNLEGQVCLTEEERPDTTASAT